MFETNPIYVINCGGLCNRLNNIINGAFISELFKRPLVLFWPMNRACHIRFGQLFENNISVEDLPDWEPETPEAYAKMVGDKCVCYKKKWRFLAQNEMNPSIFRTYCDFSHGRSLLDDIKKNKYGTLLQGGELLSLVPAVKRLMALKGLRPISEIRERVKTFCIENRLDRTVLGMHIRQTDAANIQESFYINKIKSYLRRRPDCRIFICSDSIDAENKIARKFTKNIIINPKNNYPLKLDAQGDWTTDSSGVKKYNVFRSDNSVKEALIDLCLLARTTFKIRSFGSFSNIGFYLSLIEAFEEPQKMDILTKTKVRHYTEYQRLAHYVEKMKTNCLKFAA